MWMNLQAKYDLAVAKVNAAPPDAPEPSENKGTRVGSALE
jgi:plasmid maintenance system antidote protein VapI